MRHLKGKENQVANALSRKLHFIYEVHINQPHSNILEIINEALIKDLEYSFLWQQTKDTLLKGDKLDFDISLDDILTFKKRIMFLAKVLLKN